MNLSGFPFELSFALRYCRRFFDEIRMVRVVSKNWYWLPNGLFDIANEGLFFSARYVHGLGDVDDNLYDVSLQSLNTDDSFKQRADKNTSRSWQFSVGFSF